MHKWLLIAALALTGCGSDAPPDTPLTREQLKEITTELLLAESGLRVRERAPAERDSLRKVAYGDALARRGAAPADYEASYQAYLREPHHLDSLYSEIIEDLSVLEAELETEAASKPPRRGVPGVNPGVNPGEKK